MIYEREEGRNVYNEARDERDRCNDRVSPFSRTAWRHVGYASVEI
jgi:hypothetical protein